MTAPPPRVVLVAPKHEGNVGASARAMKNFGLRELYLVAPRCRLGRQARAMAAHAGDVLDGVVTVDDLDEALADRTAVVGTSARPRASAVHRATDPETVLPRLVGERAALVFGSEDTGLDNAALDRCRWIVTLPTAPYASLNLAQAVVVLAYLWHRHWARASEGGTTEPAPPPAASADRAQFEGMLGQLAEVALRSGYTDTVRLPHALRPLRALLERAAPSVDEVARLRGLWNQLAWALEQPRERLPREPDDDRT
jgi:tRNA/rRNA methyltransferase